MEVRSQPEPREPRIPPGMPSRNSHVPGTSPNARGSGRTTRTLVWTLLGTALVFAGLALLLRRGEDAADIAATARASNPELAADVSRPEQVGDTQRESAASVDLVQAPGELFIPVGVRLAGEGRLEGFVRERASGLGVPGVRVDLQVVPPAGIELVDRIYDLSRIDDEARRRYRPVATAATEADGSFQFTGIRAGDYFLEPRGAWHVPDNLAQVTVAPSGAGGPVDAWVRAGGRVLGRVLTADGAPAVGADVWCFPGPGTILRRLREGDVRGLSATADGEGRFVFHGVPPGDGFEVAALAAGGTISHVSNISVLAGGDSEVDVVLRRGGTVRGRVLAANADGEPEPLAEAHVSIVPRGLRDLHFAREVQEATYAVTDKEGYYVATRTPPGDVDVLAWAPGHRHGMQGGVLVPEGGEVRAADLLLTAGPMVECIVTDDTGAPIEGVRASWWATDWSAFRFRFGFTPFLMQSVEGFDYPESDAEGKLTAGPFPGSPPHRLAFYEASHALEFVDWSPDQAGPLEVSLKRGGSIEGIVMDLTTSKPVERFTIESHARLEPDKGAPSSWNPFAGGVLFEGATGQFQLTDVAPGTVKLRVRSDGHLPEEVEVDVVPGEPTRGVIVTLRQGGTVRGVVTDGEDVPVAGATVLATNAEGDPVRGWPRSRRIGANGTFARQNQDFGMDLLEMAHTMGSPGPGAVLTDAEGAFELTSVPAGAVHVRAWHRDYARAEVGPLNVPAEGVLEGVEVTLGGGGAIEGTVSDRHGRPVPDAIVVASRPDGFRGTLHGDLDVYQGYSNAEGRYAIEHVPAGSYFLFLTRGDAELDPLAFLGTMNFDLVRVPENARVTYDLIDTSAAGTRVFGVVSSGGARVAGGSLFALSFEGGNLFGVDAKVAEVQADGSYEFPGLEPGNYQLRYGGEAAEVILDVEILDQPSMRLDLGLPEGGLSGSVVSVETNEPVANAEVLITRARSASPGGGLFGELLSAEGGRAVVQTGADGTFVVPRLQEGRWELVVNPPRWGPERGRFAASEPIEVEVVEGSQRDDLVIELAPALILLGTVLDEAGDPVPTARVAAYPSAGGLGLAPSTQSDSEGRFELVGLSAGDWVVGASANGFADAPLEPLSIAEGAPPQLSLVLPRGVEVFVEVLGPDGRPAPGATARLERLDGATVPDGIALQRSLEGVFAGRNIAGGDGLIDLGRHAAGRYRVEALRGGRTGTLEEVLIEAGSSARLVVALQ